MLEDAPAVRIQLCGRFAVIIDGRRVETELPGRQGRLFLAYLAANRDRPISRDEVIEVLWPGQSPAAADAAVRALRSKLRRVLGPEALPGPEARLAIPSLWTDFEAAATAVHRAESAVSRKKWHEAWGPTLVALFTARRGFLVGEEGSWIEDFRGQLHEIRIRALECLVPTSIRLGGSELAAAVRGGRELIRLEPYRESGYCLLMEALSAHGNPAEALRLFDQLRGVLRDELGTDPSPEAFELHHRLLVN